MRANEFIVEVLDSNPNKPSNINDRWIVSDDGTTVLINSPFGEITVQIYGNREYWVHVEFTRNGFAEITGEGNQFKVFEILWWVLQKWMRSGPQPQWITFSSETKSRTVLYQRMISRFSSQYGYRSHELSDPDVPREIVDNYESIIDHVFVLSKIKNQHSKQDVAQGRDFDRCYDKACQLYDKAQEKNLQPKLVQVADFQGDGSNADRRWTKLPQHVWQHYVVIVGDQVLDPTARQFGPDMPTQYHVSDLDRLWGKQYKIRPREGVAEGSLNEWVDPGAPCAHCGLPDDKHRVKFSRKNPNVSFINQDDELNDLEMGNAEDHDYTPSKGYRPLSQREAELVGFHNLNVDIPDDIYDRISNVRQRMARVGAGAGRLTRVKEQVVAEDEIDEMAAAGNFGNRIWYHGTSNRAFNKILQSGVVKPFLADAEEPGEAIWLTSDPNEALEYGKIVLAIPNSIVRNFKVERWSGFPHGFIKKYGGKPVNYNMVIKDSVPLKYWKMLDPKTGNLVNIPKVKTKEGVAEGTIDEAKKRKRKRNHSRKSITTGWWGGYWGDGSEGGDGGGVEESTQDAAKDQQEFAIHLSNLPRYFKTTDPLAQLVPERDTHTFAVHSDILRDDERAIPWRRTFAALTGKDYSRRVFAGYRPKKMPITSNTLIADMMYADFYYSRTVYKTPDEKNLVAQKYIDSMKLLNNADISSYKKPELLIPKS